MNCERIGFDEDALSGRDKMVEMEFEVEIDLECGIRKDVLNELGEVWF